MIFTLSVETDAGTYQHGFHLGTDKALARSLVEDYFHKRRVLDKGTYIITCGLKQGGKLIDVYDGQWFEDCIAMD